jgi:hypothetical protein
MTAMNADMTRPLSLAKITEAITLLPKDKAQGTMESQHNFFKNM